MNHSALRFRDKVVLISGGSRGIGLAAAERFHSEGASLAILSRDAQRGQAAAAPLNALYLQADVSRAEECARAVADALHLYGRLDVLVNAAGIIYRNRTVEETSEIEWDATLDTNAKGAFLMAKYAMPALRQTRGTIVNVASYAGLVGFKGAGAYAASKAALINLTRTIALDHAHEHIRANCVCPGSVETDMLYQAWEQYGNIEEARHLWAAKHPLGRVATPQEIASVILFLASEDASFITGAALAVDGGITAG
jgi:NAD(P)-dependent dehydrogenase (short-subunit alcohol dehydrogenase family)